MTGPPSLQDRIASAMSVATRRRINMMRIALRTPMAGGRSWPDFIVIGTQRGGTSSLFKYLSFHPEIVPSVRKEIEYFNRYLSEHGPKWYRSHFPSEARRRRALQAGRPFATFEASPTYLDHPHTPAAVARLMPDLKLIVLLRDPLARAHSHYEHMVRLGMEPFPFAQAVRFEEDRIGEERSKVFADPLYYSRPYTRYCYAYRGFYADHLGRWLDHFDRAQLLALRSEDFYSDPAASLGRILSFIGVDPDWRPAEFANFSYRSGQKADYEEMDAASRRFLEEKFGPHNERLIKLLGPEFSW